MYLLFKRCTENVKKRNEWKYIERKTEEIESFYDSTIGMKENIGAAITVDVLLRVSYLARFH